MNLRIVIAILISFLLDGLLAACRTFVASAPEVLLALRFD